jgi:hypothetical protein
VTVSTLTVAPEALPSGAAPCAEPPSPDQLWLLSRSFDARDQALARAARPDFDELLWHVKPAAGCTSPIRLAGDICHVTVQPDGAWSYTTTTTTADMPDGVICKPCGKRRAPACPSCSKRYQRDAYQIMRTTWHEFAIQRHQDGQWRSATGPASGGERVLVASVPLFAAASSYYTSSANPKTPRVRGNSS